MNNKVAVFGKRQAGVYRLSEIYVPEDTVSGVQVTNKVIPAIGSLVVDDTVGNHNQLYVVYSVDAVTHRSTLVPASMTNLTDGANQTVTFGNDVYMMFFDPTTVEVYYVSSDTVRQAGVTYYYKQNGNYYEYAGESFVTGTTYYKKRNLYEITVDSRISIYGSAAAKYSIFRASSIDAADAGTEVISQFYQDPTSQDFYEKFTIPMETIRVPESDGQGDYITCNAKRPITCYSATTPEDGDHFLLVAYDERNRAVAQVMLTGHRMTGLEVLNAARHTIVKFDVTANQYDPLDGTIYLVQNQDPAEIDFYPTITYDNDETIILPIDNVSTFAYLDDYTNAIAGSTFQIVFKHYLSPTEATSVNSDYHIGETGRFISVTKTLKVVASAASGVGKIMPILAFKDNADGYKLLPLVYFSNMSVPKLSRYASSITGFDGRNLNGEEQSTTLKYFNTELQQEVSQQYQIALAKNSTGERDGIWYYLRDTNDPNRTYYGKSPRPRLIRVHYIATRDTTRQPGKTYYTYDETNDAYIAYSGGTLEPGVIYYEDVSNLFYYKVYTSADSAYNNEAEWFLKNYYYNANPPKPYGGTSVIRPTHFLIRKIVISAWEEDADDTEVIPVATVSPISIDTFFGLDLDARYLSLPYALEPIRDGRPSSAIVEFLYAEGSGTSSLKYICGVPVDILKEN